MSSMQCPPQIIFIDGSALQAASRFRSREESAETIRDPLAAKQNINDFGFGDFSPESPSLQPVGSCGL